MSTAIAAPFLSNLYFVQAREMEYKVEVTLSRGMRCVITTPETGFLAKLQTRWCAFKLKALDRRWARIEKDFCGMFKLWEEGDSLLEEYIADNPDEIFNVSVREVIENRLQTQKRIIVLGETVLSVSASLGPKLESVFVDGDKIRSIVKLLRDDLDDKPGAYFSELTQGGDSHGEQRSLGFTEGGLHYQV